MNEPVPDQVARLLVSESAPVGDFAVEGMPLVGTVSTAAGNQPIIVRGVSPRFFKVLGTRPILGRAFGGDVATEPSSRVIVLSYSGWRRRFAFDTAALGRVIAVNGSDFTIIGVFPRGFEGEEAVDGWIPRALEGAGEGQSASTQDRSVWVVGRLRGSMNVARAEAVLGAQALAAAPGLAPGDRGKKPCLVSMRDFVTPRATVAALRAGNVALAVLVLATELGVVLLMVARYEARRPDFMVQRSLGANRWRLMRPGVVESVIAGAIAAIAGALIAEWAYALLRQTRLLENAWWMSTAMPVQGVYVAAGIALGMIVTPAIVASLTLFGLEASLPRVVSSMGNQSRAARLANRIVAAQSALAVVMLAAVTASAAQVERSRWSDVGYDGAHTLVVNPRIPQIEPWSRSRWHVAVESLETRLSGVPGLTAAGVLQLSEPLPAQRASQFEGRDSPRALPQVDVAFADRGLFTALGLHATRGRLASLREQESGADVAVLSASASRVLFPGSDPLGQTATISIRGERRLLTVIGVVADAEFHTTNGEATAPILYSPASVDSSRPPVFYARTQADASGMITNVVRALGQRNGQTTYEVKPFGATREARLAIQELPLRIVTPLALVTWLAAMMGVFGLVANAVNRHLRELGIRAAVGASPVQNVRLIVRSVGAPMILGAGIGAAATIILARPVLNAFHLGVVEPWMIGAAVSGFWVTAALAGAPPVARAVRAAPIDLIVLR